MFLLDWLLSIRIPVELVYSNIVYTSCFNNLYTYLYTYTLLDIRAKVRGICLHGSIE